MKARSRRGWFAVILVMALWLITPWAIQAAPAPAQPRGDLATEAGCVTFGYTPFVDRGSIIAIDHFVACDQTVKSITVHGYITRNDMVGSAVFTHTCHNAASCHVQSRYYPLSPGLWRGWTGGSYADWNGQRHELLENRSPCLTIKTALVRQAIRGCRFF
jgi:hypothetical protein